MHREGARQRRSAIDGNPDRMDHTGDTRYQFEADDLKAAAKAEARFKALTSVGFTAAVRDATGEATVTRSFDLTAKETLFYPRIIGG
jgi:hypothetical protein